MAKDEVNNLIRRRAGERAEIDRQLISDSYELRRLIGSVVASLHESHLDLDSTFIVEALSAGLVGTIMESKAQIALIQRFQTTDNLIRIGNYGISVNLTQRDGVQPFLVVVGPWPSQR